MTIGQQISSRIFQTTGANKTTNAALGALAGQGAIAFATPVLMNPQTGHELVLGNQIVVALKAGVKPANMFAGYSYHRLLSTPDQYLVTIPGGGDASLSRANSWNTLPGVTFASPDFYQSFHTDATTNDPLLSDQWHLDNTGQTGATAGADANLPAAWDTTTGSTSVVIAMLDNGVELDHPDLAANIFTNTDEICRQRHRRRWRRIHRRRQRLELRRQQQQSQSRIRERQPRHGRRGCGGCGGQQRHRRERGVAAC